MRIRVLREAGGLGDILRTFPVCRGLKEKYPGAEVDYYCLDEYKELVRHCPWVDRIYPVPLVRRRDRDAQPNAVRWSYLDRRYDMTVDLYCPAYRYERDVRGDVAIDRTSLFCYAAGVRPSTPTLMLSRPHAGWARKAVDQMGGARGPIVGLQPFSTTALRNWPLEYWEELSAWIQAQGWLSLVFTFRGAKCGRIRGVKLGMPHFWRLAALVKRCNIVVTPDSGVFHLAGSVGVRAIGVFGSTNGEVIRRHYPRASHIQADRGAARCEPPCNYAAERGFSPECFSRCQVIENVGPGAVAAELARRILD